MNISTDLLTVIVDSGNLEIIKLIKTNGISLLDKKRVKRNSNFQLNETVYQGKELEWLIGKPDIVIDKDTIGYILKGAFSNYDWIHAQLQLGLVGAKHCKVYRGEEQVETLDYDDIWFQQQTKEYLEFCAGASNKIKQVPRTKRKRTDSIDWVSATKTRNFLLKDTLLDWLDTYYYDQEAEQGSQFTNYILQKGIEFEHEVLQNIRSRFGDNLVITVSTKAEDCHNPVFYQKTIDEIKKGTPFIYQGVLRNESNKTYGIPDLLVRSDHLNKLVTTRVLPDQECIIGCTFHECYHYRVIDIKFSTLNLRCDSRHLLNSKNYPAYKAQLWIYTQALGCVQGYTPNESYILGRKWSYISHGEKFSGNGWFDKLGVINYSKQDSNYKEQTEAAINWIRDLREYGNNWCIDPPNHDMLYPNMKNQMDGKWHRLKTRLAEKNDEITQVWYCGVDSRNFAIKNHGISKWSDPECCSQSMNIRGEYRAPIIDQILKVNRSKRRKILPKVVTNNLHNWKTESKLEVYLDIETISDIFDDFDYTQPVSTPGNQIFMIGVGYYHQKEWKYHCLLVDRIGFDEEFRILTELDNLLETLCVETGASFPVIYHWGHIEQTQIEKSMDRHGLELELGRFIDFLQVMKEEPIVIKGAFNFGLKSVAKALKKHGFIGSDWTSDDVSNGMDAMVLIDKLDRKATELCVSLSKLPEIKELIRYNEMDCKTMSEIHLFFRDYAAGNLI